MDLIFAKLIDHINICFNARKAIASGSIIAVLLVVLPVVMGTIKNKTTEHIAESHVENHSTLYPKELQPQIKDMVSSGIDYATGSDSAESAVDFKK